VYGGKVLKKGCAPEEADVFLDEIPCRLETAQDFLLAQHVAAWLSGASEARQAAIAKRLAGGERPEDLPPTLRDFCPVHIRLATARSWEALGDQLGTRLGQHLWHPQHWDVPAPEEVRDEP
jgi:hypothetical protein